MTDEARPWTTKQMLGAAGGGLALLVLGLVIGLVVRTGSGDTSGLARPNHEGETVTVDGPGDDFERADNPSSLGQSPAGLTWRPEAGRWGVLADQAAVTAPAAGRSLAVVSIGSGDGMAQVRLSKSTNGAGLVFRYQDPRNFWAVVAMRSFGTFAVTKTVGGQEKTVANTGLSHTSDGVAVGVRLKGDTIDVIVDSQVRKTLTDATFQKAQLAGMVAAAPGATATRFDDLRLAGPRVPRPPPSATTSTAPPPPPPSTVSPPARPPAPPPPPTTSPAPPPTTSPPTTAPPSPPRNRQPAPTTPPVTRRTGPTIPLA